jgi:hypothetical protein
MPQRLRRALKLAVLKLAVNVYIHWKHQYEQHIRKREREIVCLVA